MSLSLTATLSALAPGLTASFLGVGGTAPYTYAVVAGGAGGTVNSSTGIYTAPAFVNPDAAKAYDTLRVTDSAAATATLPILVASPLGLFCDIIQHEMSLANGRVYFWDQKIFQPQDNDLYIAVGIQTCKPFSNIKKFNSSGDTTQVVNMLAVVTIDAISRGPAARDRKEEILMALFSPYAQSQQEINGFSIGRLPPGGQFVNLSLVDGAAIPYRFNISINVQYAVTKILASPFFDDFDPVPVTAES